jgi:hypothetical protein
VPLPTWGLVLMLLPATILLGAILVIPLWERNFVMIGITSAATVSGFLLYPFLQLAKERRWLKFADLEFDFEHETAGEGNTYTITATGELNDDPTYNAEYVNVQHDGLHRVTGSSMDLGSISFGSARGPGSFSSSMGRSPRSPLGHPGGGGRHGSSGGSAVVPQQQWCPSRLRPEGAADGLGGFNRGLYGSEAADGTPGLVQQQPPRAADSKRAAAGRQLASFRVRVSHETSYSDSGDGPPSPSGAGAAAGAAGAAGDVAANGVAGQHGGSGSQQQGPGHSSIAGRL